MSYGTLGSFLIQRRLVVEAKQINGVKKGLDICMSTGTSRGVAAGDCGVWEGT